MAPQITCLCGVCKKCKWRDYMRDWSRRNADQVRESARASRNRRIEYVREYDRQRNAAKKRDKGKEHARKALARAVTSGKIVKGCCERAMEDTCRGGIEGHHEDYGKPLEVRWLCKKHHGEVHRVY